MAPNITPWSVSARLVMPCAAAASISGSTRARPSSSEYSVWQCRWVNSGEAIDLMLPEARGMVAALVNDSGRPDGGGNARTCYIQNQDARRGLVHSAMLTPVGNR